MKYSGNSEYQLKLESWCVSEDIFDNQAILCLVLLLFGPIPTKTTALLALMVEASLPSAQTSTTGLGTGTT